MQRFRPFAASLRNHGLGHIAVIQVARDISTPTTGLKVLQT